MTRLKRKYILKILAALVLAIAFTFVPTFVFGGQAVYAVNIPDFIVIGGEDADMEAFGNSVTLQILFLTVLIALLPSLLVIMTSFTRLIIVLSFLRSGLGTQQMPPNTVLVGLALILTMFIMNPYIQDINENALTPFAAGEITQEEAIDTAMGSLRTFMLRQGEGSFVGSTLENTVFFSQIAGVEWNGADDPDSIPNHILIPSFILHELTTGFAIGVMIYIPFIVIDMVVASTLMAMGMMMLPPAMISLPFKVLLFVVVDGWRLVLHSVLGTFQ